MDYEAALNRALDLLADGEDRQAARLLQQCMDDIKANLDGTAGDASRYYYWGRCLTALEEYEQALLKFEKVMGLDPAHEPSLWETASIFLHDLDRPESAKSILEEKLLKANPGEPAYLEALKEAEFLLRVRNSPPEAPGEDGKPPDPGSPPA